MEVKLSKQPAQIVQQPRGQCFSSPPPSLCAAKKNFFPQGYSGARIVYVRVRDLHSQRGFPTVVELRAAQGPFFQRFFYSTFKKYTEACNLHAHTHTHTQLLFFPSPCVNTACNVYSQSRGPTSSVSIPLPRRDTTGPNSFLSFISFPIHTS